jgi:pyruvate,water dikinase
MTYIRSLSTLSRLDFHFAGGKAVNLGELIQAGLPVPAGFVVTTDAYRLFVAMNCLEKKIEQIVQQSTLDDPAQLENASEQIRDVFENGRVPADLLDELRQAYNGMGSLAQPVAVRSSATAEDLPDLSFAGQQDTYLNVIGEDPLCKAVVACWASLWTSRVIAYRAHNQISNQGIALAVLVQKMVQSEVSGVLFTANPLTGKRTESIIDATFGLGEALVSGQVEPDHYVVDRVNGRVIERQLGSKALSIYSQAGGGTVTQHTSNSQSSLTDEQILELASLGQCSAEHFGCPQDLEWALADQRLLLLQSRPITTLYALPPKGKEDGLEVFLSFGVWQGMLDPYTPFGQDSFPYLISGIGKLFGSRVSLYEQRVFCPAGERLFVNITGLFKTSMGRMLLGVFTTAIDTTSGEIIKGLMADDRLNENQRIPLCEKLHIMRGFLPFGRNFLFNVLFPERGRLRLSSVIQFHHSRLEQACDQAQDAAELVHVMETLTPKMATQLFPTLVAAVGSGMGVSLQLLTRLAAGVPEGERLLMDLSRGLPHNVTLQMDLDLWKIAAALRAQPAQHEAFARGDVADLVCAFQNGDLPQPAQSEIGNFFDTYGMRGVGEIDLGRTRWIDDPTPVFQILKSYVQIDAIRSPDIIFNEGEAIAKQAAVQLKAALAAQPGGFLKAALAGFFIRRFRALGGLRESPKFAIVRQFGVYRQAFRKFGRKFADQGVLRQADDIFFLHPLEIKALSAGMLGNVQALIADRRELYQREFRRRRIPRILLSDGTAYYEAVSSSLVDDENSLTGNAVSAGIVEGRVRVVFDPHQTQLMPGEILVCPATDPAWTPLFLSAGGLVMEVGGMVTHGSVVAREYGIPAVVGVKQATLRLKTGQLVRVDGSSGRVIVLEDVS